jgi:hypothetical protein
MARHSTLHAQHRKQRETYPDEARPWTARPCCSNSDDSILDPSLYTGSIRPFWTGDRGIWRISRSEAAGNDSNQNCALRRLSSVQSGMTPSSIRNVRNVPASLDCKQLLACFGILLGKQAVNFRHVNALACATRAHPVVLKNSKRCIGFVGLLDEPDSSRLITGSTEAADMTWSTSYRVSNSSVDCDSEGGFAGSRTRLRSWDQIRGPHGMHDSAPRRKVREALGPVLWMWGRWYKRCAISHLPC